MDSQPEKAAVHVVSSVPRVRIGDALVDSYRFHEVIDVIVRHAIAGGAPKYVVTPNAQHIVLLAGDEYLRRIYSEAAFVLPDGMSLLFAARLLGQIIPHRLAGVDVFDVLCGQAAQHELRIFLLGGRPGSAERAAAKLQFRYPGLLVSGVCCPPVGFEKDERQRRAAELQIQAANPHLLFVGLGAPKQEYWIYENARKLRVPIAMGVGGSFEMVGGVVKRAPLAVQRMGCEWLYRLLLEPRRMWRRYLIGNLRFASLVLQQRLDMR
jgi:N-acetylglucosaminyldiphosphoundecaprenol N-acetyl-beta-D-mannosaminyltransferase